MTDRKSDLTESEVHHKVADRKHKARQRRIRTYGGLVAGFSGLIFAFIALIQFENSVLSTLGFIVMGVGFGLANPEQIARMLGRGGHD